MKMYHTPTHYEIVEARMNELEDLIFELEEKLDELEESDLDERDEINWELSELREEMDNCESELYRLDIEALTRDYYRSVL